MSNRAFVGTPPSPSVLLPFLPTLTQALTDLYKRHMVLMTPYEIFIPKHHLMLHLTHRARETGNPLRTSTFFDEALNKNLKLTLRNCHQATFEVMALVKMAEVLRRVAKRSLE